MHQQAITDHTDQTSGHMRQVRDHHAGPDLLQMMTAYAAVQPEMARGPRARIVSREYRVAQMKETFSRSAAWRKE